MGLKILLQTASIVIIFLLLFLGVAFFTQKATDIIVHGDWSTALSLTKSIFWFIFAVFFVSFLLLLVAIIFEVLEWRCSASYTI